MSNKKFSQNMSASIYLLKGKNLKITEYKKTCYLLVILVFFGLIIALPEIFAEKQKPVIGEKALNFILEDAYEKQYESEQMKGKVIVLIMGSRKTKENNNRWVNRLHQKFIKNENLMIFTIFDMRGIPFFISDNFVRNKIKEKQKKYPVTILIDFGQKVNKLLDAEKNVTEIFIIDSKGILVDRLVGTYSEEKFIFVRDEIMEILESNNMKDKKSEEKKE